MIDREALLTHIRPLVEDLAVDLATLIGDRLNGQLEQALDVARSALASDIDSGDAARGSKAITEPHRDRINMLRRTASAAIAARQPVARRPTTCRNCGAVGFTSKGCGTSHQPLTQPAASVPPPVLVVVAENDEPEAEIESDEAPAADVELDDQDDDDEIEVAVPKPGPRDRFAEIEALAKKREAAASRARKSA